MYVSLMPQYDDCYENDSNGVIYLIKNRVNSKCYVGQTSNLFKERIYGHLRPSKKQMQTIHCAIQKHGKENFIFGILEYIHDDANIDEREKFWISKFDSFKNGYNETPGGKGIELSKEKIIQRNENLKEAYKNNPEYSRNISEKAKFRWANPEFKKFVTEKIKFSMTDEVKKKISEKNIGKKHTEESKSNISKAQIGRKLSEEHKTKIGLKNIGRSPTNKGIPHSEETIRLMSSLLKDRWKTHEYRSKFIGREPVNKGKKSSEETKEKLRLAWVKRKLRDINGIA